MGYAKCIILWLAQKITKSTVCLSYIVALESVIPGYLSGTNSHKTPITEINNLIQFY